MGRVVEDKEDGRQITENSDLSPDFRDRLGYISMKLAAGADAKEALLPTDAV